MYLTALLQLHITAIKLGNVTTFICIYKCKLGGWMLSENVHHFTCLYRQCISLVFIGHFEWLGWLLYLQFKIEMFLWLTCKKKRKLFNVAFLFSNTRLLFTILLLWNKNRFTKTNRTINYLYSNCSGMFVRSFLFAFFHRPQRYSAEKRVIFPSHFLLLDPWNRERENFAVSCGVDRLPPNSVCVDHLVDYTQGCVQCGG